MKEAKILRLVIDCAENNGVLYVEVLDSNNKALYNNIMLFEADSNKDPIFGKKSHFLDSLGKETLSVCIINKEKELLYFSIDDKDHEPFNLTAVLNEIKATGLLNKLNEKDQKSRQL